MPIREDKWFHAARPKGGVTGVSWHAPMTLSKRIISIKLTGNQDAGYLCLSILERAVGQRAAYSLDLALVRHRLVPAIHPLEPTRVRSQHDTIATRVT